MRVFCYDCGTSEETDWLVRCPKCQTKNIGLEPEEPWHWLNRLWASSRGWQGDGDELSLPWWFEKHPKLLPEWIDFKAQLNDVDAISPPTDHQLTSWSDFYDFWIRNSGILPLTQGTASDNSYTNSQAIFPITTTTKGKGLKQSIGTKPKGNGRN
jgi:hypothetical protein